MIPREEDDETSNTSNCLLFMSFQSRQNHTARELSVLKKWVTSAIRCVVALTVTNESHVSSAWRITFMYLIKFIIIISHNVHVFRRLNDFDLTLAYNVLCSSTVPVNKLNHNINDIVNNVQTQNLFVLRTIQFNSQSNVRDRLTIPDNRMVYGRTYIRKSLPWINTAHWCEMWIRTFFDDSNNTRKIDIFIDTVGNNYTWNNMSILTNLIV